MTASDRSGASLSVAVCTYQGERYLQEQLDSISGQTRCPDEVAICDDGSTDGTMRILERFRSRATFPVLVRANDERLGPSKNFEQAIGMCTGDMIFLADQDDVWHPKKLATQVLALTAAPEIGAVFSDADVVDPDLVRRQYTLWQAAGFTPPMQRKFARRRGALPVLLKRNVVSGMTLGFKARLRKLILPIPAEWYHDAWIALLVSAVAEVVMIPKRLVKYRQHDRQHVGLVRRGLRETISEKRKMPSVDLLQLSNWYAAAHARLAARMDADATRASVLRSLEAKSEHIRARATIRSGTGRFKLLAREMLLGNYQRYGNGWRSFAVDAFLS